MSSGSEESVVTEVVFEVEIESSSEDPPRDEWSSLEVALDEENPKRVLFDQGLYHPGSGEICAKYIAQSDSDVFRHPYYNYPAVLDPGITDALFKPEEKIIYADDGQELYLAICKDMNQCPVRMFHRGLLEETIDLSYYGVNPFGIRPMAKALKYNRHVKVLNLKDNFLNNDSCFHLSEMLASNSTLEELHLSGCRIGPEGARRIFAGLPVNRALRVLDLSRNELGDAVGEDLAKAVFLNMDVREINLSCNGIGGKGIMPLVEALETHNKFTHVDLSKNSLYTPPSGIINLLNGFGESKNLQVLNISYNSLSGPKIGTAVKNIFQTKNLRHLDVSNNKFFGEAIENMVGNLAKAKKLETFDLSFNPLTPADAVLVLSKLKSNNVKVQNVLMENVFVNSKFLTLLSDIKNMKSKKNLIVTYGGLIGTYKPVGPDPREVLLNRAEFLAKKPKKRPVDIALVALQLLKDNNVIMENKSFATAIKDAGAPLDDALLDEMVNVFAGPKSKKMKTIDIGALVDYIRRKWPDRKLPPTPPPEPEPEPEPEPIPEPKGKDKGKGKGQSKVGVAKSNKALPKESKADMGKSATEIKSSTAVRTDNEATETLQLTRNPETT